MTNIPVSLPKRRGTRETASYVLFGSWVPDSSAKVAIRSSWLETEKDTYNWKWE